MSNAFVVFVKESTRDQSALDRYSSRVKRSFEGREVAVRAAYGHLEVLEGPQIEGAVILEFPSVESARAWYYSPSYQEAAMHRFEGGELSRVHHRRRQTSSAELKHRMQTKTDAAASISREAAEALIEAARQACRDIDIEVAIAVTDAGGALKAFSRDDGAAFLTAKWPSIKRGLLSLMASRRVSGMPY